MRVSHIITALDTGGCERQLVRLLPVWQSRGIELEVIALGGRGPQTEAVEALGIPARHPSPLGRKAVAMPARVLRHLHRFKPDVVQTWMYHADLLGSLGALPLGAPVLWNVRQANVDPKMTRPRTLAIARACATMSGFVPRRIVANSQRARNVHVQFGYDDRFEIIPNGFDLDAFYPDAEDGSAVRELLEVPADAALLGHAARLDPTKDHETLFRAFRAVLDVRSDAMLVCMGRGVTADNPAVRALLETTGLTAEIDGRLRLLGERSDVDRIYRALDVLVLSSRTEAFPNVIGEAMASGVPCVATDAGEVHEVLGTTGVLVPPGRPDALAEGVLELLEGDREALARAARERIRARYRHELMADRYIELWQSVRR